MSDWEQTEIGGLPLCQTLLLTSVPGIIQGFTMRQGGVSKPPYESLNLGSHVEDNASDVQRNRRRLWEVLDFSEDKAAFAEQVHGRKVVCVSKGGLPVPGADALITNTRELLLVLFFADCVPVYLMDPVTRSIGLVHAGWRGTVAGIVPGTVTSMQEQFGSQAVSCRAAIGPCISGESYEVGSEVAAQFRGLLRAKTTAALSLRGEVNGTYSLDLRQIIFDQLLSAGLSAKNIAISQEDTFRNERDFFSFRRDGGKTGRMAAFFALK